MAGSAKRGCLEAGWWVALTLRPGAAPLRCYVGEVQAVDDRGVRITLVDWVTGRAVGNDLFAPWAEISAALVCTPDHDRGLFGEDARRWQALMGSTPGAEE